MQELIAQENTSGACAVSGALAFQSVKKGDGSIAITAPGESLSFVGFFGCFCTAGKFPAKSTLGGEGGLDFAEGAQRGVPVLRFGLIAEGGRAVYVGTNAAALIKRLCEVASERPDAEIV